MISRDGEDAVKVGHMKVSKLNVGAVERDRVSLFEAFDQHSMLCRYYESQGFRRIGKTEHFFFVVDDFLSMRAAME